MTALAEKVLFCVQWMGAVRWLTSLMPDDHAKRLVARATFVYLDAFLKLAPRLKNQLKDIGAEIKSPHRLLRSLDDEYEANYATTKALSANDRSISSFVPSARWTSAVTLPPAPRMAFRWSLTTCVFDSGTSAPRTNRSDSSREVFPDPFTPIRALQ
jgi:hypothetical protein